MEGETGYGYQFSIYKHENESQYLVRVVFFSPNGTYDKDEKFYGPARTIKEAEELRAGLKSAFERLIREQINATQH